MAERELRLGILNGTLGPGTRLLPRDVAARLNLRLSSTPLREALLRLREQGLVEIAPNRGASVAPLSRAELDELYELRLLLEPQALERSVRADGAQWRAAVGDRLRELRRVTQQMGYAALDEAHRALHAELLSQCDSQWLLSLVRMLADNSSRYRASAGRLLGTRSGAGSAKYHKPLVDACLARDAELAASLCYEHIRDMHDRARESLAPTPVRWAEDAGAAG